MEKNCVFCKIIAGEIPCAKVYEDERVLAFLDIAPFNFGHTLVVPKAHCHCFTEIPAEDLAAMMAAAQKLAVALMRATGAPAYNLLMNNGQVAGQEVPHAHLHIIPRHVDDTVAFSAPQKHYEGDELAELSAKIRERLAKKAED
ncbi:MAG: HIT family protein [Victivallales bacterium]|nr:HIT family protein [Victivallales bacterium]